MLRDKSKETSRTRQLNSLEYQVEDLICECLSREAIDSQEDLRLKKQSPTIAEAMKSCGGALSRGHSL